MNVKQRMAVLIMDVMLLLELAVCMYLGQHRAGDLTGFFVKTYLPVAAVTVILAWLLTRMWRGSATADGHTAGLEP
jgi:hypothetical protein